MPAFKDSYVMIYHGSRRGGKTLSMVVQVFFDLLAGRKVFCNVPIAFIFRGREYRTQPFDYYSLLAQDEMYKGGVICWDEAALWLYSRDSGAQFNKLATLSLTLVGKWECNLYCTLQFLNMLDKNIRQQADAIVLCTDLSFKYSQLGRGTTIGQIWQDISGRFTGDMYEMSKETFQQTLHGKEYWQIYDTKKAFDIFDAKRKVKMDYNTVNISEAGVNEGNVQKGGHYSQVDADALLQIQHIIGDFASEGKDVVSPWEIKNRARNVGLRLTDYEFSKLVPSLGLEVKGNRYNPLYVIPQEDYTGVLVPA